MSEINTYHMNKPRLFEAEYHVPSGLLKIMIYLMSLILPIGLAAGLFYSMKPGQRSLLFGRNCLILSVTPIFLSIIIAVIFFMTMAILFMIKY